MVKKIEAPDGAGQALPAAGPGQVEDLADLAREAASMQAGEQAEAGQRQQSQQQAEAGQRQQQAASAAQEIAAMLAVARDMAADLAEAAGTLPRAVTVAIWTDQRLATMAAPLAAIAERHGGAVSAFMEQYGPYVMLIAAGAMPAITTVKAVRAHKAINVQAREVPTAPGPGGAEGGEGG